MPTSHQRRMLGIMLDALYYCIEILIDHIITKSYKCDTLLIQVCRAGLISLVGKEILMYFSIQFYAEVQFVTEKIKYIRTDRVLSAETDA